MGGEGKERGVNSVWLDWGNSSDHKTSLMVKWERTILSMRTTCLP